MSPATSEAQKTLACIALSIKRGETKASYSKQAAKMASEMKESELVILCGSPIKKK